MVARKKLFCGKRGAVCCALSATALSFQLGLVALASEPYVWNAGGGNLNMALAANWAGGIAPANGASGSFVFDIAHLANDPPAAEFWRPHNNRTGLVFTGLVFAGSDPAWIAGHAGGWDLRGNAIALAGGISASGGTHRIALSSMNLGADVPVDVADGVLQSHAITGEYGLVKGGSGTLDLIRENSYSGPTTVLAGTLLVNADSSAARGLVTVRGGAVLGGAGTLGGDLHLDAGAKLRLDARLTLAEGKTATFGGMTPLDVQGLGQGTAPGTYALLSGDVDFANVAHVGEEQSLDLGGGVQAYFQAPELHLVVSDGGFSELLDELSMGDVRTVAAYIDGTDPDSHVARIERTTNSSPLRTDPGVHTIVVLPDTQFYIQRNPDLFSAQIDWIVANKDVYNIRCVIHVGDIVQIPWNTNQWQTARQIMAALDGKVPYAIVGGNHDYGTTDFGDSRATLMNGYFPAAEFRQSPHFGGLFEEDRIDNSYHLLALGNQDIMVLNLEWAARDAVVDWANQVVAAHPDHRVVLNTHAYLYYDGTRYDWNRYGSAQRWGPKSPRYKLTEDPGAAGGINDGEDLWRKLVARHPNFFLTLNGHCLGSGLARLESPAPGGNTVHQVLVNYQWPMYGGEGGQGYLRIMQFLPDGKSVLNFSYSPVLNIFRTDGLNQFVLHVLPGLKIGGTTE